MNISEYIEAARRFDNHTEGPGMIDALVHGAVGEAIELWEEFEFSGQLSWLSVRAEAGDVAWNLARLTDELGIGHHEVVRAVRVWDGLVVPVYELAAALASKSVLRSARSLLAFMEKAHRKNGPLLGEMAPLVLKVWADLQGLVGLCGWTMSQVMQSNVDKLTARYAERGLQLREA